MGALPATAQLRVILEAGGVIAYPTEGVWGLGCLPGHEAAVMRLLELKSRSVDKGLILLGTDVAQFDALAPGLVDGIPEPDEAPVTWLVPHADRVPYWIHGGQIRVAVRLTRPPVVAQICSSVGLPVVSTSANPASAPPALTEAVVRDYFADKLDAIVAGSLGGASGPSKIVDLATGDVVRPA